MTMVGPTPSHRPIRLAVTARDQRADGANGQDDADRLGIQAKAAGSRPRSRRRAAGSRSRCCRRDWMSRCRRRWRAGSDCPAPSAALRRSPCACRRSCPARRPCAAACGSGLWMRHRKKADPMNEIESTRMASGARDRTDQEAGDARTGDLGGRAADLELRVALEDVLAVDQRRQVRLVGDVEEDGQAAVDEADQVQLPDGQRAEGGGDRDRQQRGRPAQVADDQDRPPAHAVDPHAGGQADQDERQELDRRQQAEFERGDVQDQGGDERDGQRRHLRAELADRLARSTAS